MIQKFDFKASFMESDRFWIHIVVHSWEINKTAQ